MRYPFMIYFSFLLVGCYNVDRDCSQLKTGKFEFKYNIDGVEKVGQFKRTENYNIDYYEGVIDTSTVRWINDCEFILKKINPKSNSEKEAIHMKILSTTDSSYTFEYKLAIKKPNRPQRVERGIAVKVN